MKAVAVSTSPVSETVLQVTSIAREVLIEASVLSGIVGRPVQITGTDSIPALKFDVVPGKVAVMEYLDFQHPFAVLNLHRTPGEAPNFYDTVQEAVEEAIALVIGRGRIHVAPSAFDPETEEVVNLVVADHPASPGTWSMQALEGSDTLKAKLEAATLLATLESIYAEPAPAPLSRAA